MRPEAAALYTRGLERFSARDYAGAIADLEAGYAIEPRREFLFAEGQAKRLAGDCKGAVALYQRFLATNPHAVQANATQIALGRCAQHLADHPEVVVVEPPRPPPPPPPPPPKWWRDPCGLGFTGAGVAAISVGVGFIAASYAARDDAEAARTLDPYSNRWSTAESRWQVGVGTLALGAALTAVGVTRFVVVRRQAREAAMRPPRSPCRSARAVCRSEARFDRRAPGGARRARPAGDRLPRPRRLSLHRARPVHGRRPGRLLRGERPLQRRRHHLRDVAAGATFTTRAATPTRACRQPAAANKIDRRRRGRRPRLPACAHDGSLWCWGRNNRGQLGDGTRTPRALPVRVAGIDDVIAVAAGDGHTCAATAAGAVFCWGADDTGQLGDRGGIGSRAAPAGRRRRASRPRSTIRARSSPRERTSRARSTRAAACSAGATTASASSVTRGAAAGPPLCPRPSPASPASRRSPRSWQHVCALTTGGQVSCWGANDLGQIGDGTTTSPRAADGAGPRIAAAHDPRHQRRHRPRSHLRPGQRRPEVLGRQRGGPGRSGSAAAHRGDPDAPADRRRDRSDRRRRRRAAHLHRQRGRRRRKHQLLGRGRQRAARRRHVDRKRQTAIVAGRRILVRARQR